MTMTFAVESGVTRVTNRKGRTATAKFPLADMAVGDSFLIPFAKTGDVEADKKVLESWRRKVLTAKKPFDSKVEGEPAKAEFSTAAVAEGLRVWRTA